MREALNAKNVAGSLWLLSFSAKSPDDDILYLKNDNGQVTAVAQLSTVLDPTVIRVNHVLSVTPGQGAGRKIFEAINHYAFRGGFKSQELVSVLAASTFYEKMGFMRQEAFFPLQRNNSDVSVTSDFDSLDQFCESSSVRLGRLVDMLKVTESCLNSAVPEYGVLDDNHISLDLSLLRDALRTVLDTNTYKVEVHRACLRDLLLVSQDRFNCSQKSGVLRSEWKLVSQRNSPVSICDSYVEQRSSSLGVNFKAGAFG